eukprot:scaffold175496_cov31-Prasinocladus_malaysianus.AAC.1
MGCPCAIRLLDGLRGEIIRHLSMHAFNNHLCLRQHTSLAFPPDRSFNIAFSSKSLSEAASIGAAA